VMRNTTFSSNKTAVSEIVGAVLLVVIALGVFAIIYSQVFPVKLPGPEPHVQLAGYVDETGMVVLEHIGGEELSEYQIYATQSDGMRNKTSSTTPWRIGEAKSLDASLVNYHLFNETKEVRIQVVVTLRDGSTHIVFDGIITPKSYPPSSPDPMLVSTLRTNTNDEDLICYTYSIHPVIIPKTYIYRWMVSTAGSFTPLTALLLPFDTQQAFVAKDYSGNKFNGTVNEATWISNGKLGGAYQYDGNDFISIPYCFTNTKIDTITIESWIKTSQASGTIISYNRSNYCELAIAAGHVKWSTTNTSEGSVDLTGNLLVNDNQWHLIAVTYNASSGYCRIYVDGTLDIAKQMYAAGKLLGTGDSPTGTIGKGAGFAPIQTIYTTSFETQDEKNAWIEQNTSGGQQPTWTTLKYDTFNNGWGNYIPGSNGSSADCYRSSTHHEGTYSACVRDKSGVASSFKLTNPIDMDSTAYKSLMIDFWWMWNGNGWTTGKDFWILYYNGTAWINVFTMAYPSVYTKGVWYHQVVYVNESDYRFPSNMRIRFQCDALGDNCLVYFDQIYLNVTSYGRIECDFNILPATAITPHSGLFCIGGDGDFDPEYAIFNRTAIDISHYTNVKISVWYSYKNTDVNDFLGFYYKNNTQWVPIFVVSNPSVGGQQPWAQVVISIPKSISSLVFQFKWRSTSTLEYLAIDDLEITGVPLGGENNFTGVIDEVKIYHRELSQEQLYQNYLSTHNGYSAISVLVSEELHIGELWKCLVIPNDSTMDDAATESNIITIIPYGGGG
jgi:hypothetical protein